MTVQDLNYPHVTFRRTALRLAVCQVRFDPILKIAAALPADFQDLIRTHYQQVREEQELGGLRLSVAPEGRPSAEIMEPSAWGGRSWVFVTNDGTDTASLGVNYFGVETTEYTEFPRFLEQIRVVSDAAQEVYGIPFFGRVGLRYVNIFDGATYGRDWDQLFNPHLVGPLGDQTLGPDVVESKQQFMVATNESRITIRHGHEPENSYRLDIDQYTEAPVEAARLFDLLESFHAITYQVFRWSITDRLVALMGEAS